MLISATHQDYASSPAAEPGCDVNGNDDVSDRDETAICAKLDDGYVPICADNKHFPTCLGGGIPRCNSGTLLGCRNNSDLGDIPPDLLWLNSYNLRIEAEKITEDCSTMEAEDKTADVVKKKVETIIN